jgi:hypothetical protein
VPTEIELTNYFLQENLNESKQKLPSCVLMLLVTLGFVLVGDVFLTAGSLTNFVL